VGGIDVRQTGTALVIDALLQDSSGVIVTTGTTTAKLYEVQSDGTLKSFDWSDFTFKTTTLTTETQALTVRTGNNGATNTGYWSFALTTLTGFTVKATYLILVANSGAFPPTQMRKFQYGSAEGDLATTAVSTGVADIKADVTLLLGNVSGLTGLSAIGLDYGNLGYLSGPPGFNPLRTNTATAGGATSITLDAASSAVTDFYKGCLVFVTSGTGSGQYRIITAYNGTTKVATVSPAWAVNPANGSGFAVLPSGLTDTASINGVSTSSVTVVAANLGTTQPVNFTGTGSSAMVKSDMQVAGGDVNSGIGLANLGNDYFADGHVNADLNFIVGTALTEGVAGQLAGGFVHWFDVASPSGTVNSLPNAPPAQSNGLLTMGINSGNIQFSGTWTQVGIQTIGALTVTGAVTASNALNAIAVGTTERTAIAAAWGASIIGNSRTRDMFLQGLTNKIAFDVPGIGQYTLFSTDDTTPLKIGTYTASVGASPVIVLDPS
jgi:hypothetical protein